MILIDFDKLMEQYDFYNEFAVHDLRYIKKEYLPFVEAIPVEWIKSWAMKNWVKSKKCEYDIIVSKLIDDWLEEENELV